MFNKIGQTFTEHLVKKGAYYGKINQTWIATLKAKVLLTVIV